MALLIVTILQSPILNAAEKTNNRNVPVIIGTRMPSNVASLRLLKEKNSFFSVVEQKLELSNMGKYPCNISINGTALTCNPGDHNIIRLKRTVDPLRKEFFAPDFLNEPKVEYTEKK